MQKKLYKTDITIQDKRYILSLHYNDNNSYLHVNGEQELKFKGKDTKINRNILCIGNVS